MTPVLPGSASHFLQLESESPPPLLPPSPLFSSSLLVFASLHLFRMVGALAALMHAPPREHHGQVLKEGKPTKGSSDTTQTNGLGSFC